jgi:L-cysteine S-thiosulfotransferase
MKKIMLICAAGILIASCAVIAPKEVQYDDALNLMKNSFKSRGQADVARLEQDEIQRTCSAYAERGETIPKAVADQLEAAQLSLVKYPQDGKFLGDWKAGETVAQSGRGFQWNDAAGSAAGGNCYACHQMAKAELSYGNIGPSLNQYGKLRGTSEPILKYTWGKIYNAHAYNACSNMPRFGLKAILTERQLQDVMALLLDPNSPVNQ